MVLRWSSWLLLVVAVSSGAAYGGERSPQKSSSAQLPITTSSRAARKNFDLAMQDLEYMRLDQAVQELRSAVKADSRFAQAWIFISHLSHDPEEQETARQHAKQLEQRVTPGERLLIRWLAGVQEDDYVTAIAAMNDLLADYPKDQRLAFLAGRWLVHQERYPQSIAVLERAVKLDANYAAALNELAYAYAFSGQFEKAFPAMERYIALQPDQPNPHDSYGEILRLAGKFDAALEQYRTSIRIDPNFGSEIGVADTYAVMGKEPEAREEYARAIVFTGNASDKIEYELQSAITWIRENNRKQAEKSLRDVAKHAHSAGLAKWEAESHRVLAMYASDPKEALKHLQEADIALEHGHGLSRSDKNDEQARIARVRATREAEAGNVSAANEAVHQLEVMAQSSRSPVIQLSYHAAAGAVLASQGNFADAIPHLEEDAADPMSMRLLWKAYSASGSSSGATEIAARLSALNVPTAEQALVVPQFRASLVSQAQQP